MKQYPFMSLNQINIQFQIIAGHIGDYVCFSFTNKKLHNYMILMKFDVLPPTKYAFLGSLQETFYAYNPSK